MDEHTATAPTTSAPDPDTTSVSDPTASLPRDPDALAQIGRWALSELAKHEESDAASRPKPAPAKREPKRRVTERDIAAVTDRLYDVAMTLTAIHGLAPDIMEGGEPAEWIGQLIRESARSSARAVDACMNRLDHSRPGIECFADDLSDD